MRANVRGQKIELLFVKPTYLIPRDLVILLILILNNYFVSKLAPHIAKLNYNTSLCV